MKYFLHTINLNSRASHFSKVFQIISLTQKTTKNIIWNFLDQVGRRGIGIVTTIVISRYLTPFDYGLMSMIAIYLAIGSSLMESGFRQALIRLEKPVSEDFDTAFYANISLGLISYLVLFCLSPSIAKVYNEPALIGIIRLASFGIVINSFQVVQVAILSSNLNFKLQMKAGLIGSLLSSLISIFLSFKGFGVWALVCQMLIYSFVTTIFLWTVVPWKPSSKFSKDSFGKLYSFGGKLFFSGLLDTIYSNIYVVIIAKLFNVSIAGYFFFADKIKQLIVDQAIAAIHAVVYPALTSISSDDLRLKNAYRKLILISTFLYSPIILSIAAFAKPVFELLLSKRWQPSVPYFQLMCITGLFYPIHSINLDLLKVKGRSDLFLYLEIVKKLLVSLVIFMTMEWGVYGILCGQIFISVVSYFPNCYFSKRLVSYSIKEQAFDFAPSIILAFVIFVPVFFLLENVRPLKLVEFFFIYPSTLLIYLIIAFILRLKGCLNSFELIRSYIKSGKNR
jgi:O-antigen/teichoic acid export membrane protein